MSPVNAKIVVHTTAGHVEFFAPGSVSALHTRLVCELRMATPCGAAPAHARCEGIARVSEETSLCRLATLSLLPCAAAPPSSSLGVALSHRASSRPPAVEAAPCSSKGTGDAPCRGSAPSIGGLGVTHPAFCTPALLVHLQRTPPSETGAKGRGGGGASSLNLFDGDAPPLMGGRHAPPECWDPSGTGTVQQRQPSAAPPSGERAGCGTKRRGEVRRATRLLQPVHERTPCACSLFVSVLRRAIEVEKGRRKQQQQRQLRARLYPATATAIGSARTHTHRTLRR